MSTYTLAFTICNYKSISSKENIGPALKIWAPEQKLHKAKFALESAARILKFLENYLNIRYPLRKIDFVSVPNFIKDGMENWGIISLR